MFNASLSSSLVPALVLFGTSSVFRTPVLFNMSVIFGIPVPFDPSGRPSSLRRPSPSADHPTQKDEIDVGTGMGTEWD